MSGYALSQLAEEDLTDIWEFIANRDGIDRADGVRDDLEDALQFLVRHQHAGHHREELAPKPFRFWSVHQILIIYQPDTTPLEVARLWHAKRGTPEAL